MRRKVALVGVGKIARDQHVPAIEGSDVWELAATVSRQGTVDGVDAFTDFDMFLEKRPDVGVVSLCVPPVPRFAYAQAAIRAGRHVMLEKPPGATVAECLYLQSLAMQAGVTVFASWHSREAAMVPAAKEWLKGKKLKRLRIMWKEDVRRWHPGQDWIWEPGGLGVFDPGINAFSIATAIVPEPIHVSGAELIVPENCQTPIAATVDFALPSGADARAELDFRRNGSDVWDIAFETDGGTLLLSEGGWKMQIDGGEVQGPGEAAGEYPMLYARMAELVGAGALEMDVSPLVLVADAFLLGKRTVTAAFVE